MSVLRLFLPFAGGYFLSYHFRTANAVIGPVMAGELGLGAADLGFLTSAYFLGFGAAQLPLGMLLDRFGARRVESTLLLVAAAGALIFASGTEIGRLAFGRGLIGVGVSACLMASFKAFSQSYPLEHQASLTGWMMTAGALGAVAASAPLDAALQILTWRQIFVVLAALTVLAAGWIFFGVPEQRVAAAPEPFAAQWAGVRAVVRNRHFWRYAPLALTQTGGFLAVQGLWSSAWLIHVNGYSRGVAADHLAAMSVAMVVAYALIGLLATQLARRGIGTLVLYVGGVSLALVSLLLMITQAVDQTYLLWIVYGMFSSFGTLVFPLLTTGFPVELSGRTNTTLNLFVITGAFVAQWGIGVLIDLSEAAGYSTAIAHRNAFTVLFLVQTGALIWLLVSGRRKAAH